MIANTKKKFKHHNKKYSILPGKKFLSSSYQHIHQPLHPLLLFVYRIKYKSSRAILKYQKRDKNIS